MLERYKLSVQADEHGWNSIVQTTDLSHDTHEGHGANVGALATHVTARYYLKAGLLCGVDIVRNESVAHYLLLNWVSARFDCKCVGELRPRIVVQRHKLCKTYSHVEKSDSLAYFEHDRHMATYSFD